MPRSSDDLFRALADPTRRRILDLLAERGTATVGELAGQFPDLVASGISKHLMALRAAGLVTATRQGRQQLYRLDADAFAGALAPWLAKYAPYWSDALRRLGKLAEEEPAPPRPVPASQAPKTDGRLRPASGAASPSPSMLPKSAPPISGC
jgi:DNA-binding transcriptional ArsR family regulator